MKHNMQVTLFLLLIFLLSQVFGLFLISQDAQVGQEIVEVDGVNQSVTVVEHDDTAMGPRPQTQGYGTIIYLVLGVTIGTLLVLLIVKYGKVWIWKVWFFLAVTVATTIALGVLLDPIVAMILAIIIALWKILKPNLVVHNISEILIYAGIALLIVPMFKLIHTDSFFSHPVFIVTVLLLLISLYDMWAVWKSKHMVKMAQFQTKSKVFAGLFIPYSTHKQKSKIHVLPHAETEKSKIAAKTKPPSPRSHQNAILGGGDIAFPLIFSGVVMEMLLFNGLAKNAALLYSLIITLTTGIALFSLLYLSKKDRFYPAMPFVTAGCLLGYGIILLLL